MKPRNFLPSTMLWSLCFLQDSVLTEKKQAEQEGRKWTGGRGGWCQQSQDTISYQLSASTQNPPTSIWLYSPVSVFFILCKL